MKHYLNFFVLALCLGYVSQSCAQVLEGPKGPVEFIGLNQWTASELFKAIQEQDPEKPFHACAAVMIGSLEFPDAAAFVYMTDEEDWSKGFYTVVVGVEDSSAVRYRTPGTETLELPESWKQLQSLAEQDWVTVNTVVYVSHLYDEDDQSEKLTELAEYFGANPENSNKVVNLLEGMSKDIDHELALKVLSMDESWSARLVAAIVLGHSPEIDKSWHGLADSLIDSAQQVRDIASKLITGLTQTDKEVPVNWSEARETLLALLGGTYAFAFNDILKTLVATKVDPGFGAELARQKPELLLAHAGAEHEKFRKASLDFLRMVSGEDFGSDIDAWHTWIHQPETAP